MTLACFVSRNLLAFNSILSFLVYPKARFFNISNPFLNQTFHLEKLSKKYVEPCFRSSRPEVFCKKAVLKNLAKFSPIRYFPAGKYDQKNSKYRHFLRSVCVI